jgi:Family of unknown function (DUF5652)
MQNFPALYSPYATGLMLALVPFIIVVVLWTVIIKGFALWHSARNSQKWWFIALLVINTVGILEIIYLIWFRPTSSSHASAVSSSSQA